MREKKGPTPKQMMMNSVIFFCVIAGGMAYINYIRPGGLSSEMLLMAGGLLLADVAFFLYALFRLKKDAD